MLRPLILATLSLTVGLAAPSLAQPKAPASKAATKVVPKQAPKTIRLYDAKGKPIKLGHRRLNLDPKVVQRAAKIQRRKGLRPLNGMVLKGRYWAKDTTVNPKQATVTQWVHLIKRSLKSSRAAHLKAHKAKTAPRQ